MDVDSFIAKYRGEWQHLETATARGPRGVAALGGQGINDLTSLYLRVSGHLSEAQTRYRDERLLAYLTRVVGRAHGVLYGARARSWRGFAGALGARYRDAFARTRVFAGVTGAILIGGLLIVTAWVALSPEAQLGVIPSAARDATRRAGASSFDPLAASGFILANNVQVSFLAFAGGIAFGAGTLFVLATNAYMIGTLAGAFHVAGRAGDFWSLVLPHGFLELLAISITAAAGLRMGWALVDPGDRARAVALADEARDAVLVVTGAIPAFAVAAVIEGFLTPSSVPDPVKIGIGAAVAAAYLAFLFAPRRARRVPHPPTAVRTP